MYLIVAMLIRFSVSQTPAIKVVYNSKSYNFYLTDLSIKTLKLSFNISDIEYLEDLSGNCFYPFTSGSFPSFISSEVYVRQKLPSKNPTIIYPTETIVIRSSGLWPFKDVDVLSIGYYATDKTFRRSLLNFRDLSVINLKRKIYKVYIRLIGRWPENFLPIQIFAHKIEADWQGINNWNEQPIHTKMPITSTIVINTYDIQYVWDVTDLVLEWTSGLSLNNGILLKTDENFSMIALKEFYIKDPRKKPALLVYYSD